MGEDRDFMFLTSPQVRLMLREGHLESHGHFEVFHQQLGWTVGRDL